MAENQIKPIFSAPLHSDIIKQKYHDELTSLFTEQHLQLIMSYYCGERGSPEENLQKHPLQYPLFNKLVSEGVVKRSYKQKCRSEEMRIMTNIKNMWSTNTIFQKLLGHLLLVLLRFHLTGNRAANRSQKTKEKKLAAINAMFYFLKKEAQKAYSTARDSWP